MEKWGSEWNVGADRIKIKVPPQYSPPTEERKMKRNVNGVSENGNRGGAQKRFQYCQHTQGTAEVVAPFSLPFSRGFSILFHLRHCPCKSDLSARRPLVRAVPHFKNMRGTKEYKVPITTLTAPLHATVSLEVARMLTSQLYLLSPLLSSSRVCLP